MVSWGWEKMEAYLVGWIRVGTICIPYTQAFAKLFLIHDWNVRDAWPFWIWSDADGIPRCLTSSLWISNVPSTPVLAFCLLRQFSAESIIAKLFLAFLRRLGFNLLRSSEVPRYLRDEFRPKFDIKSFRNLAYLMRFRIHAITKN